MSFWTSKSRRRVPSPDTDDMFFEAGSNFPRSNLAERLGSSVFDEFPTRRSAATMRNFPTHTSEHMPFGGSLHRHQRHHVPPGWLSSDDFTDSRESSPQNDATQQRAPRHPSFQRTDSNPSRATPPASRQDSRHGSRSSTPESTGSGHSHRSRTSTGTDEGVHLADDTVEEHPGVTARNGRPSFTARRQPKVHHIPITVEPRDGSSTPVVLTPPVDNTSNELGGVHPQQQQQQQQKIPSESPPVTRCSSQTAPEDGNALPSSSNSTSQPGPSPGNQQSKSVPSPPVAATAKKPPFRSKAKATVGTKSPVPTKTFVPEPVFPTTKPTAAATPEPELPKPATAAPSRKTPVDAVNDVLEDVAKLREVVAEFAGAKGDKHYLYLDEMLTRNLIRLDNISTEGNDEVRQARRGAVLAINECLGLLDTKAAANTTATAAASVPETEACPPATEEMQVVDEGAATSTEEHSQDSEVKVGTAETEELPQSDNQPLGSTMDVECTIGAAAAMDTDESPCRDGREADQSAVSAVVPEEKSEAVIVAEDVK